MLIGTVGVASLLATCGCKPSRDPQLEVAKPPRPVSVMTLNRSKQLREQLITGSIAPWKTEQLGFEVAGRLNFVIELNEEIQPVLPDGVAAPATPLATLDPERFQIAVDTALADVQVAKKNLGATQVSISQRLPALIESAESELEVAQADFDRVSLLVSQSAISQADFDDAKNRLRAAKAALAASQAQLAQANAQQEALKAQVTRAEHAVEEAKRNLRNAKLFSSFRGIVSQVHTVPGSYVSPGDPVVTVQMMDPMLVEFEVSPRDARRYSRGDILDVFIPDGNGNRELANGMVYTVDAVADPDSRTYTVALHLRNQKQPVSYSDTDESARELPTTDRVFSLNVGPIITGDDRLLVEQRCLHKLGDSTVVWKIKNRKANHATTPSDRILLVEPVRVTPGSTIIPLLGQWSFVPVVFDNPKSIDIENDLITGKIQFASETAGGDFQLSDDSLAPRRVLLSTDRWKLRTGDVVQVLMAGKMLTQGFFVPMKAVLNDNGKSFIHAVERSENGNTVARRVEVMIQEESSAVGDTIRVPIVPIESGTLQEGTQIVVAGTHYLTDGSHVNVVTGQGSKP